MPQGRWIFSVQARGGFDLFSIVRIEQDVAMCAAKCSSLVCRTVAAHVMAPHLIGLFLFEPDESGAELVSERHYRLAPPEEITAEDMAVYRLRPEWVGE